MTSVGAIKLIDDNWDDVEEIENVVNCSIYPNPANDFVKLSAFSCQLSAVRIYNTLGMLVEEIEVKANEVEINTSGYKSGVYFVEVQTDNGSVTKKFVKN